MSKSLNEVYKFFEDNMEILDGKICAILYKPNARDKVNIWQIIIELYVNGSLVNITKDMVYIMDLPESHIAKYHSVTGQMGGKMKESKPININAGKNAGKINRTTVITQAIIECRSKYNTKVKSGFSREVRQFNIDNMFETDSWRFAPPAYYPIYDHWDLVKYPCYIQPKVDGNRLLAVHNSSIGGLGMFTRRRSRYESNQPFVEELDKWLVDYPSIYVDGEVGIRGQAFQDMSGLARRKENTETIYYYIFDIFISYEPELPFSERLAKMAQMFDNRDFQYIKFLPTYEARSKADLDKRFEEFMEQRDEGAIVRLADDIYGFSFYSERRSKSVFKWKLMEDAEWPVVGYTAAKGNQEGAIMWKCKEKDEEFGVGFAEGVFSVEDRQKIYQYLNEHPGYFEDNFYGRELTIMYTDKTKDGIPRRGGAKRFREDETQQKIIDILNS